MIAEKNPAHGYRFDDLFLDVRNRRLSCNGEEIALNSKYFDVLHLLVRHGGQLVEKQRIFDEVWNRVIVTDSALTQCIKDIRKALNDDPGNPRCIKTVPKHGYVFIGNAAAILRPSAIIFAPLHNKLAPIQLSPRAKSLSPSEKAVPQAINFLATLQTKNARISVHLTAHMLTTTLCLSISPEALATRYSP